jgi:hypothetical protein
VKRCTGELEDEPQVVVVVRHRNWARPAPHRRVGNFSDDGRAEAIGDRQVDLAGAITRPSKGDERGPMLVEVRVDLPVDDGVEKNVDIRMGCEPRRRRVPARWLRLPFSSSNVKHKSRLRLRRQGGGAGGAPRRASITSVAMVEPSWTPTRGRETVDQGARTMRSKETNGDRCSLAFLSTSLSSMASTRTSMFGWMCETTTASTRAVATVATLGRPSGSRHCK